MGLKIFPCLSKYFLFGLNFLAFLAGTVALACGIWNVLDANSFVNIVRCASGEELTDEIRQIVQPDVLQQAGYILIGVGVLTFIISFLGCCGACRESKWFLASYGLFIIIILLLEITLGILAAVYTKEAEENTQTFLKSSIKQYYAAEQKDAVTLMWDYTMAHSKCCGVNSYEDFKESKKWTEGNKKVIPEACCILEGDVSKLQPKYSNCTKSPSDTNSYWKKGCYNTIVERIQDSKVVAIGIIVGLGLFKLLLITIAFYLCTSIQGYQGASQLSMA
jgi:tetraspanin-18